jgi:hypothetical protein
MFNNLDTSGIPCLDSWIKAVSRWERTKPWRGYSATDERPLDNQRRAKHKTIKRVGDDIVCRLYRTDVVTYHSNGDISLTPWASASTDDFANKLLGYTNGLRTCFNWGESNSVRLFAGEGGWQLVGLKQETRFTSLGHDKDRWTYSCWQVADPSLLVPFKHYKLNTQRANAALKARNYPTFRDWFKACTKLTNVTGEVTSKYHNRNSEWAVDRLALGASGWQEIVARWGLTSLDMVRDAIYREDKCVDVTEHLTIDPDKFDGIRASARKYRWFV